MQFDFLLKQVHKGPIWHHSCAQNILILKMDDAENDSIPEMDCAELVWQHSFKIVPNK